MLKPEYFDGKEQRMMELYQQLSEYVLKEAARFLGRSTMVTRVDKEKLESGTGGYLNSCSGCN